MTTRRKFIGAGVAATGAIAAPAIAKAQTVKWRMVTSWPKRLPGPGMSAEPTIDTKATALAEREPNTRPASHLALARSNGG